MNLSSIWSLHSHCALLSLHTHTLLLHFNELLRLLIMVSI
jgi:hypothetical protein